MGLKLAFLTGARSEYGLAKGLLRALAEAPWVSLEIIVSGMHLLNKFGHTADEIRSDGFHIAETVATYSEEGEPKAIEFAKTVVLVHDALQRRRPDAVFLIGDRIESYASALAAHFAGIFIIHGGGGHITTGAVDNIYRYNISNLAGLHLTTSRTAFERLRNCPLVHDSDVHLVGSAAVDAILAFKKNPKHIREYIPDMETTHFCLMTFHPATAASEPIGEVMQAAIDYIVEKGVSVLITYPNNDPGSDSVLDVIETNRNRPRVVVVPSLGAEGYYSAINDCCFVIGNSSSGLMEAPYFQKPVVNVGSRQDGRDKDVGVRDVPADKSALIRALEEGFREGWPMVQCSQLYGDGNAVARAMDAIYTTLHEIRPEKI